MEEDCRAASAACVEMNESLLIFLSSCYFLATKEVLFDLFLFRLLTELTIELLTTSLLAYVWPQLTNDN